MDWLLLAILALPAAGAVLCALWPNPGQAKGLSFAVSLLTAALTIPLLTLLPSPHLRLDLGAIPAIGFHFTLAADSISLWLMILTVFLQPLAIAASFSAIQQRQKEYYAWMLALLTAMLGVFMAGDLLLFYVFFELTLVPMFFIIGIWGGPERRHAAVRFFLFTFSGSVFTLAAIIYLGIKAGTFDIPTVIAYVQAGNLASTAVLWVVLGLLAGFAVKVPLFPVHTWLPLAHTEAPTAGSVILAGVLLKLGTYGILRLALPIGFIHAGQATSIPFPLLLKVVGILCLIGIIYGSLVAWVQQDIKKLVAYSSVAHLGFCVLGLAALNFEGVQGSILYMINHGLSTGALFLVVGMIYERYHTRDINQLSGLARKMPVLAFFFIFFTLSSIALPGLNGFPSEFLTTLGAFKSQHLGMRYGVLAAVGMILGAVYMLHMAARVIWGPFRVPAMHATENEGQAAAPEPHPLPSDLSAREVGILVPIALAVVAIGVIPARLLDTLYQPVRQLIGAEEGTNPRESTRIAEKSVVSSPLSVAATDH